jgi:predicted phosphodiesterase
VVIKKNRRNKMVQVEELISALEEKYKISIQYFLELYQGNIPREEMAMSLDCQEWTIRTVANSLNLRMAKKYRQHDYSYFLSRFGDEAEVQLTEELTEALSDLDELSKDLVAKEKQLDKARREVSKYRRAVKTENPLDLLEEAIGYLKMPAVLNLPAHTASERYKEYTQYILLSDLHFEATVSSGDVGLSNSYTWGIAEQRLNKVITELVNSHRGEGTLIFMLGGDLLDGLIHTSLETANKPLGQAVADLAVILSNYIRSLSSMYDYIHVPCVSGNHERLSDYKRSHNQGFGYAYMIYKMVEALTKDLTNVGVDVNTCGYTTFSVGLEEGKTVGLMHGDFMRGPTNDVKILKAKEAFRQVTHQEVNHVFSGHTHVPEVRLFGNNDHWIVNGSLIGTNAYSITNGFTCTDWAQAIGSFLPDGSVEYTRFIGA